MSQKDFIRIRKIGLLFFGLVFLTKVFSAQSCPPAAEKIAKAHGFDSFGQIEAIRYTFTIPAFKVSRSWIWEPKADRVTFEGKDKEGKPVKVTYARSQLSSQPDNVKKEVDPSFVNDQYWLLFPFHACWDTSAHVEDTGMQKLPLGGGTARRVVVKYAAEVGGYTPGDTWELYVGPDNVVKQMLFRHGGSAKPGVVIATWAGYKKAGHLLIATEHRGTADGKPFSLTFSDVAVKLTGSDAWVPAQ